MLKLKLQYFDPLMRSEFFIVQLSHPYMTTGKTIPLTRQIFFSKIMSLLFNMLSRFAIGFLPRTKCLLISWLQPLTAVILEPEWIKSVCHCFRFFRIYLRWSDGTGCCDLSFWTLSFKPAFSLSSLTFIKRLLCHLHIWGCWYFSQQFWFWLVIHPAWYFGGCTLNVS